MPIRIEDQVLTNNTSGFFLMETETLECALEQNSSTARLRLLIRMKHCDTR